MAKKTKKTLSKKQMKKTKGGAWLDTPAGQRTVRNDLGLEKRGRHNPEPTLGPLADT